MRVKDGHAGDHVRGCPRGALHQRLSGSTDRQASFKRVSLICCMGNGGERRRRAAAAHPVVCLRGGEDAGDGEEASCCEGVGGVEPKDPPSDS